MNITLVTSQYERQQLSKMLDSYGDYVAGRLSRAEWDTYPKETWLDCTGKTKQPFIVYDNHDGQCYVEAFASLDGAVLYASGVHLTDESAKEWDFEGSVRTEDLAQKHDAVVAEREGRMLQAVHDTVLWE